MSTSKSLICIIFAFSALWGGIPLKAQAIDPKPFYYVPDQETAVKIGEAVLVPLIGKAGVDQAKPFEARLEGDLWIVFSVHNSLNNRGVEIQGGEIRVRIDRATGRIFGWGFAP